MTASSSRDPQSKIEPLNLIAIASEIAVNANQTELQTSPLQTELTLASFEMAAVG
ncbi:MAG: hypothetical protein AAF829_04005 [Pseudomonadota bacterium]